MTKSVARSHVMPNAPSDFDAAVRAVIMQAGGWNRQSRTRVSALAAMTGRSDAELRQALSRAGAIFASEVGPSLARAPEIVPQPRSNERDQEGSRVSFASSESGAASETLPASVRRRPVASRLRRVFTGLAMIWMIAAVIVMSRALALRRGDAPPPDVERSLVDERVASEASFVPSDPSGAAFPGEMPVAVPRSGPPSAPGETPRPIVEPGPRVEVVPAPKVSRRTGGVLSRWEARALEFRDKAAGDATFERLSAALALARLNAAADLAWSGQTKLAEAMIEEALARDARQPARDVPEPSEVSSEGAALTAPGEEGDGKLALLIFAARRQPGSAVDSLARRRFAHSTLGPVDCDAVAECALYGSPLDLRLVCRKIAIDQRENPAMAHALLEALPRASSQPHVSELIAELTSRPLPSTHDAMWPVAARSALVAHLASLLSRHEADQADELTLLLSLALRAGDSPGSSRAEGDASALEHAAQARCQRWVDAALGQGRDSALLLEVDRVTRRRDLRLMLAAGPIQRFVAWQASTIDAMSFVVTREQPSLARRVADVVGEGAARVRDAGDATTQVFEGERTMLRLWLLRMGSPRESGAGGAA